MGFIAKAAHERGINVRTGITQTSASTRGWIHGPGAERGVMKLVADADAVVNNLRGDVPAKLGLDYGSLSKINPAIVCLHISAYGRDNERASWPGYDFLMQAEAGYFSLTGEPGALPARFGLS